MISQFHHLTKQFPEKAMQGVHNENVSGNSLVHCKNAHHCFDSRNLWDCRYISQGFGSTKDSVDCTEVGEGVELFYECSYGGYSGYNNRMSTHFVGQTSGLTYCFYTPNCADLFGCIGVHHVKYAVLNKQYSKDDYLALTKKIVAHMKETGEWGEFFPAEVAPFPYNITHAHEYYPLTKDEALKRGYRWYDPDPREYQPASYSPPETIMDVTADISQQILKCDECGKNYRFQRSELELYRKLEIPLPRKCPDCRHQRRFNLRTPRKLYHRTCAASGQPLLTALSPDHAPNVFSDEEFAKALV